MKITLILPAIGKKPGQRYIGTWKMEPLTIAVIKGLTPAGIDCQFFDDRIEQIDYQTPTDLVLISVETYTAKRAYAIAARFKQRGIPVVLGGYHVTLAPEEAAQHADSLVIGNIEAIWPKLLSDFSSGEMQNRYVGKPIYASAAPDLSIYRGKKYLPVSLVETGRGCPHACEFCAISSFYASCYHPRPLDAVLDDLRSAKHGYVFLVDDNLVADRAYAKALFTAMIPLKLHWAGQGTLNLGRDPELLQLMKASGCELILIGFETLSEGNLRQMHKAKFGANEREKLVRRIHRAGINIYATFVFGYDDDGDESFAQTLAFCQRHRFFTAAFNHLLAFPGTPLYQRLAAEGRLLHDTWWLDDAYRYGDFAFTPKRMSAEEMSRRCYQTRKAFNKPSNLLRRSLAVWQRSGSRLIPLFWMMNLPLSREVDDKMRVRLGAHLDESPK